MLQLGNDARECEAVLEMALPTTAEREDVRTKVLGHVRDQTPAGMCGNASHQTETDRLVAGGRIRSTTCQSFCSNDNARTNGLCGVQLREYCAHQTKAKSQEHSCNCWLKYETYKAALDESQKELKLNAEEEAKIDPGPSTEGPGPQPAAERPIPGEGVLLVRGLRGRSRQSRTGGQHLSLHGLRHMHPESQERPVGGRGPPPSACTEVKSLRDTKIKIRCGGKKDGDDDDSDSDDDDDDDDDKGKKGGSRGGNTGDGEDDEEGEDDGEGDEEKPQTLKVDNRTLMYIIVAILGGVVCIAIILKLSVAGDLTQQFRFPRAR